MTNDFFDKMITNSLSQESHSAEFAELDALFSDARSASLDWSASGVSNDNFTKMVVNSLPKRAKRQKGRSLMFDMIGLLVGLVAAYWFFDLNAVVHTVLNLMPESVSLTIANMVAGFSAVIGLAYFAWWTSEKAIS